MLDTFSMRRKQYTVELIDCDRPGPSIQRETNMKSRAANHLLMALVIIALTVVSLGASLSGNDDPAKDKEEEEQREQRLKDMTRSAEKYTLASTDTPTRTFQFNKTPVLRSNNPVSGNKDSALFVWTDRGRPAAVLKIFTYDTKTYTHAWQSLSEGTLTAERGGRVLWKPADAGIAFRVVPDSPKPGETAAERLRQMKTIAGKFTSTYTAAHLDNRPSELRLLPQPIYRYEAEDTKADGTVFAFVQTTSPVVVLLLETRSTPDGPRWHYEFTSLVSGPVKAKLGDKEIFSLEKDYSGTDRTKPYVQFHGQAIPKE